MATFLPIFGKKITGFEIWKRFGGGLEHPNIWLFDHFNRQTNYGRHTKTIFGEGSQRQHENEQFHQFHKFAGKAPKNVFSGCDLGKICQWSGGH